MTPDNSPTAAAMPEPAPPKARAQYALNNAFTRLLKQAESVNEAAQDARFSADLSARGINAAFTDAQKNDIERGRTLLQSAHAGRNQGKAATQSKSATRQTLELLIGQIQSAALQRDVLDNTDKAANYYIGADVAGANESQLDAIAEGIIEQLGHDDIPGVTPAAEAAFEPRHTPTTPKSRRRATPKKTRKATRWNWKRCLPKSSATSKPRNWRRTRNIRSTNSAPTAHA